MQRIMIHRNYPVDRARLWDLATDYSVLSRVMKGLVRFDGLPEDRIKKGQTLDIRVSLLGWLPKRPYRIDVVECDERCYTIRTEERGHGINRWNHTTIIAGTGTESLWIDFIEIEAGWLTIPATLWARLIYTMRHPRRLRMLGV